MRHNRNNLRHLRVFTACALASMAVFIIAAGWWLAYVNRAQFSSNSLWPMPDSFLIHWTVLGLLGVLAVYFSLNRAAWFIVGAWIPLIYISAWSFGLLTFFSFLFIFLAALVLSIRPGQKWLETLGVMTLGAIANLLIVNTILAVTQ